MIARGVNAVDPQVRNSMITEVRDIRPGHPLIQSRDVISQYQHALFRDLHTLFQIRNCLRLVSQLAKWVPHAASAPTSLYHRVFALPLPVSNEKLAKSDGASPR
jgi:hypothetical protein